MTTVVIPPLHGAKPKPAATSKSDAMSSVQDYRGSEVRPDIDPGMSGIVTNFSGIRNDGRRSAMPCGVRIDWFRGQPTGTRRA